MLLHDSYMFHSLNKNLVVFISINQGGWDEQGMLYAQEWWEMCTNFCWNSWRQEIARETQDENIKMHFREIRWKVVDWTDTRKKQQVKL
jgi:hypothetical protein